MFSPGARSAEITLLCQLEHVATLVVFAFVSINNGAMFVDSCKSILLSDFGGAANIAFAAAGDPNFLS
jgi:hypothetical protein